MFWSLPQRLACVAPIQYMRNFSLIWNDSGRNQWSGLYMYLVSDAAEDNDWEDLLMLLRSWGGLREATVPGGIVPGLMGRVIMIPSPRLSILGLCCSSEALMIRAIGLATISFECLNSSLLMPSGPAAWPFWREEMAAFTSSATGVCSGLAFPMNVSSPSLSWSVNCFWNRAFIVSALPWSSPHEAAFSIVDHNWRGRFHDFQPFRSMPETPFGIRQLPWFRLWGHLYFQWRFLSILFWYLP